MMKALILSFTLLIACFGNTQVLYKSHFYRLNDTDFMIHSFFLMGSGACFPYQARAEQLHHDTVFLKLVFDTRPPDAALGCQRLDTLTQTIIGSQVNYINVSTGIITFNDIDQNIADTLWGMYDSTFNAVLGLADLSQNNLQLQVDQQQLTVTGSEEISHLQLIDLNGKQLVYQQGNTVDVSLLAPGVYLLRVFSGANNVQVVRWYKE
jgi:hypothetical protein